MLIDHGIEENEGGAAAIDPRAADGEVAEVVGDGATGTVAEVTEVAETMEVGVMGVGVMGVAEVGDAAPAVAFPRRGPDVVGRFLAAVRDEALAARDAGGLTPADVRALYWTADAVGEPGYFADLSAGPLAPAWYPDPTGRHQHRYWNGQRWTAHVADDGATSLDHG